MSARVDVAAVADRLAARLPGRVRRNVASGEFTTYRVGGPFAVVALVGNDDALAAVADVVQAAAVPVLVVGRGSNLLVADSGFDGVAVVLGDQFERIVVDPETTSVLAGGSASLPILARRAGAAGVSGLEFYVGIPGSVGGAVRMNAGGHGRETREVLVDADLFDLRSGARTTRAADGFGFGYRRSNLDDHTVVCAARFTGSADSPAACGERIDAIVRWRREHQPGGANAGSVFSNPPGDSAGRLIDEAGLKGLRVGGAVVSEKHANFIVAGPTATAGDVRTLLGEVRARVARATGTKLQTEVRLIGFGATDEEVTDATPDDDVVIDLVRISDEHANRDSGDTVDTVDLTDTVDITDEGLDPFDHFDQFDQFDEHDDLVAVEAVAVFDGDDIEILHGDETEVPAAVAVAVDVAEDATDDGVDTATEPAPGATRRPPVDPRIRARRIAVQREQGRRRLRVVLVLLSFFVVAGVALLIVQSPFVDVDHIVVTGVPEARVAAVVAASGVDRHDPLLLVSAGKVARRVEQVPGVGLVHVSRDFPGTVRISVRELGVGLWTRVPAGGVALVGHDGRVVRLATAPPPGVAELRGVKHVPGPGGRVVRADIADVLEQLPAALVDRVGAISAATPEDIRLYLIVGGEVRLGDLTSADDKGAAAEAVIERMACPLVYVDVRSLSNPVALPAPNVTCGP